MSKLRKKDNKIIKKKYAIMKKTNENKEINNTQEKRCTQNKMY